MTRELQRFIEKVRSIDPNAEVIDASVGDGTATLVFKSGKKKTSWKFTV